MKYTVVFGALGIACLYYGWVLDAWHWRGLALWGALAFGGVGVAYAGLGARVFGKRRDGRLHPLMTLVFAPFHVLNALGLWSFRRSGREAAFDRIEENVVLGCRLNARDEVAFMALGVVGVLDVCGEFGEVEFVRGRIQEGFDLPEPSGLDARAPTLEQLELGANGVAQQAARGPVYGHCALGHGRSATFVAAFLLQTGRVQTAEAAVALVAAQRPRIGLSAEQMARLQEWEGKLSGQRAT